MTDFFNATINATAQFVSWSQGMIEATGYIGVFLVSLIGTASIFFPVPSFAVIFAAGAFLNPFLVALFAGLGATIGEVTGYALGLGGRHVLSKKYKKSVSRTKEWIEKRGVFVVILLFAITPLPDDVVGILAGIIKYDIKKFFIATFIGKFFLSLVLALAGFYGIGWLLAFIGAA